MKKSLLSILGSFALVLTLFALLNGYFNAKLSREQHKLVLLDNYSGQFIEHTNQFQELTSNPSMYDSVNKYFSGYARWIKVEQENLQSLIRKTFELKDDLHVKNRLIELQAIHAKNERILLADMAKIGFKESGFIGKMREIIHTLETKYPGDKTRILSLRRHEKDFIMRQDEHYADKLHAEVSDWTKNAHAPVELKLYVSNFDSVKQNLFVFKGEQHKNHLSDWRNNKDQLTVQIRAIRARCIHNSYAISSESKNIQLIVAIVCLVILIGGSIFIVRNITHQVSYLQETMSDFIAANYHSNEQVNKRLPKNEIGQLSMHFIKMARKIEWDVQVLEDRVKRRTESLNKQNELLEIKHKEITDSLRYAQEIQRTLLISKSQMQHVFDEVCVHYTPKNHVGGDFYWMKTFREHGHDKVLFALADCTGHGVPGALLSVLGINILDELFSKGIRQPHLLLQEMRNAILDRFLLEGEKRMDGMDIALFSLDLKSNDLLFAGAQMPLWILRDCELIELKGDRVPVGFTYLNHQEFDLHHVALKDNDRILLFSDGIVDQFGRYTNKKMGKKQLRYLLLQHAALDTESLFRTILNHFNQWKDDGPQTDDCTLILLKANSSEKEELQEQEDKQLVTAE